MKYTLKHLECSNCILVKIRERGENKLATERETECEMEEGLYARAVVLEIDKKARELIIRHWDYLTHEERQALLGVRRELQLGFTRFQWPLEDPGWMRHVETD